MTRNGPDRALRQFGVLPNTRQSGDLELHLRCLVYLGRALHRELKSRTGLPWKQRYRAWRAGFSSTSWQIYKLDQNDPDEYLADLRIAARFYKINGFFNPIIGNKLVLSHLLAQHGIAHPRVVALIIKGALVEEGRVASSDFRQMLSRTLERYPRLVFRPTWSGSGFGVFFLRADAGELMLNGRRITLDDACALLSRLDRYLITEQLTQAVYAREIFPDSANTIRILTLWDGEENGAFVPAAAHRFGTSRSAPIDNWHQGRGGVCADIDLETAAMGNAVWKSGDGQLVREPHHPETGQAIRDVVVPGFQQCLDAVLKAANSLPFCPVVGWDVLVTEQGPSVIEANPIPSVMVNQIHRPLLRDPRCRRFFQRHGLAGGDGSRVADDL